MKNPINHSVRRMYILQFRLDFQHLENNTIAYILGIKDSRLDKIIRDWKQNENCIMIESKMNFRAV